MKIARSVGAASTALALVISMLAVPAEADALLLDLSVGFKGGVTGTAVPGIDDGPIITGGDGRQYQLEAEYYPMFGVGGAFAPTLELRLLDMIALETGFHISFDNGAGWEDQNDARSGTTIARVHQEQATTAFHVPLLVKVNVPSPLVRPFFGIGLEWVFQSTSEITYRAEERNGTISGVEAVQERNQIEPSNYTLLAITAGAELKFGPVRVPIELRAGYNLDFEEPFAARARHDKNSGKFYYNGAYQGHFGVFTGVMYNFDFML